jgi:hypothetical protein
MKAFLQVLPDGYIRKMVLSRDEPPGSWIVVEDEEEVGRLVAERRDSLWLDGRLRGKQQVILVPSKRTFKADGVDSVSVDYEGLPPRQDDVRFFVGDTLQTVAWGDSLTVTSVVPGPIRVTLAEPLLRVRPLRLVATP